MTIMSLPALTFTKTDAELGAMRTYTAMLDGVPIGTVSKVRDRYLRSIGPGRGQNVPAARDAWRNSEARAQANYDTRAEAAVDLIASVTDFDRADAMDIVRGRDEPS
jgi:hypothetical protein